MSITRAEIKYEIWTRLNKTATSPGFYTSDKLDAVIRECLDYITTEMMLADEGWVHKIDYFDTVANQVTVPVPPHMSMISEVRYLVGNIYTPLQYDQQWGEAQWSGASGVVQFPSRYKIVDNMLYFNPALGVGGPQYLQVEYMAYPPKMRKDSDVVPSQFDRTMFWYTIYRSCNLLAGQVQQTQDDWVQHEAMWGQRMRDLIGMRTRQAIPIRDFDGF